MEILIELGKIKGKFLEKIDIEDKDFKITYVYRNFINDINNLIKMEIINRIKKDAIVEYENIIADYFINEKDNALKFITFRSDAENKLIEKFKKYYDSLLESVNIGIEAGRNETRQDWNEWCEEHADEFK